MFLAAPDLFEQVEITDQVARTEPKRFLTLGIFVTQRHSGLQFQLIRWQPEAF